MKSDLEFLGELQVQYAEEIRNIIPLLPTLLALLDFKKTPDLSIVRQRMSIGYYGSFKDGEFIAPSTGPYCGFLSNISTDDLKQMKELVYPEKT